MTRYAPPGLVLRQLEAALAHAVPRELANRRLSALERVDQRVGSAFGLLRLAAQAHSWAYYRDLRDELYLERIPGE